MPLKHLSAQQDPSDDRRSPNVKRRIEEGEVLAKREAVWTLGIPVRGVGGGEGACREGGQNQ